MAKSKKNQKKELGVGSIIALIIMAVVGPMIKAKSPGPILYKQERIGRNGKKFKMYKFRSMYKDAEASSIGYATVYPFVMFLRILSPQIMLIIVSSFI